MNILDQTESINLADKGAPLTLKGWVLQTKGPLWLPLSIELAKKFILNELLDQHNSSPDRFVPLRLSERTTEIGRGDNEKKGGGGKKVLFI